MATTLTNAIFGSVTAPGGIPQPAQILALQTPYNAPQSSLLQVITNGLNIPPLMVDRFRSFPEEIYSLKPTDHVVRFTKALLGAAGSGQYRNRIMQARLQKALGGANFYQLDSFYGALFGVGRFSGEQLSLDPFSDLGTYDQWSQVLTQDSSYRDRIDRFSQAVALGPTPLGIQLIAEAILQVPCRVTESTYGPIVVGASYASLNGTHYSILNGQTYAALEHGQSFFTFNPKQFTIIPSRQISMEEDYNLREVINVLKPADAVYTIEGLIGGAEHEIVPRGVFADSSYWTLVESVIPNAIFSSYYSVSPTPNAAGFYEVLRPPYAQYQGEQIVYNPDVVGVVGFESLDGVVTGTNVADTVIFMDGSSRSYVPTMAMTSRYEYLSGRIVSDGILQSAPSNSTSADPEPLYVDGMSLGNLNAAIEVASLSANFEADTIDQYFWATPNRLATDQTQEVLDVHLDVSRLVNHISFDIAHFPQNVVVYYYDSLLNEWVSVYETAIYDSLPAMIPVSPLPGHVHPQHFGNGHWYHCDVAIPASMTSALRVEMTRLQTSAVPVQQSHSITGGNVNLVTGPVPYSLGLRNLSLSYQIISQSDLPTEPIYSLDYLGSKVQWAVRQEVSENVLANESVPWRSAPQPSSDCVVNFYVDTRDSSGNAQAIDQIFLDPLYVGAHCTLYYSNSDTADLGAIAECTPLDPPSSGLSPYAVGDPVQGIIYSATVDSWTQVSNLAVQFDPTLPWWIGISLQPQFSSVNANGQVVWDTGEGLQIILEAPVSGNICPITLKTYDGQSAVVNKSFSAGDNLVIVAVYNPGNQEDFNQGISLFAGVNISDAEEFFDNGMDLGTDAIVHPEVYGALSSPVFSTANRYVPTQIVNVQPTQFFFGYAASAPAPANFTLKNIVLKAETARANGIESFVVNPHEYCQISPYADIDVTGNTTNSIMRFDPTFVTSTNPSGVVGGPGNFYQFLDWAPVLRDFIASKGFMHFPPTLARFWKLEFTSLSPQPVNSSQAITRTVRTFQGLPHQVAQSSIAPTLNNPGASLPGSSVNQSAWTGRQAGFLDKGGIVVTPAPDPTITPPTATQVPSNLSLGETLSSKSWVWQYQQSAQDVNASRFIQNGTHNYAEFGVTASQQVGYFVGLNSLKIYRANALSPEDSLIYDEMFLDEYMISDNQWNQSPGDLTTEGITVTTPIIVESDVMPSTTPMIGLQFATSQSDAFQLAYDDRFISGEIRGGYSFDDPTLPNGIGYLDSGTWTQLGDETLYLDSNLSQIVVTRTPALPVGTPDIGGGTGGAGSSIIGSVVSFGSGLPTLGAETHIGGPHLGMGLGVTGDGSKLMMGTSLFDTTTMTVIHTFTSPHGEFADLAIHPSGDYVYSTGVVSGPSYASDRYDLSTYSTLSNIAYGGSWPALSPDGTKLCICDAVYGGGGGSRVFVLDTSSMVATTISGIGGAYAWLQQAAFSPDGSKIWVSDGTNNILCEINTTSLTVTANHSVSVVAHFLVVSPDGLYAYLGTSSVISKVDLSTFSTVSSYSIPSLNTLCIDPSGNMLYAADISGNVYAIATATMSGATIGVIALSGYYSASVVSPANDRLYFGPRGSDGYGSAGDGSFFSLFPSHTDDIVVDSIANFSVGQTITFGSPTSTPYTVQSVDVGTSTITTNGTLPGGIYVTEPIYLLFSSGDGLVHPDVWPIMDETPTSSLGITSGYGGLSTSWCLSAPQATLWAAVKVTAISGISNESPLYLQIMQVNGSTPIILQSVDFIPSPGKETIQIIGFQVPSTFTGTEQFYAQVVNYGASNVEFIVSQLSLFDEGCYWEFSNDAGLNWVRAFGIRNNAQGSITFAAPNNQLVWRVTATQPGITASVHVHGLRIRPIYQENPIPHPQGVLKGPNLNFIDHEPLVENDPWFRQWPLAVPYWWYYQSNNYASLGLTGTPSSNQYSKSYVNQESDSITYGGDSVVSVGSFLDAEVDSIASTPDTAITSSSMADTSEDTISLPTDDALGTILPKKVGDVEPVVHPVFDDDI